MIILNSNKELVRVEGWDDILSRPGFSNSLDPKEHELSGIVGQYAFAEKKPCGLSNCHTPHFKGYLVVTKSGRETNIGRDCGKKYFGIEFENMALQFDRDIRDKEARERLWSFSFGIDKVKDAISTLREGEHGADWAFNISRPLKDHDKSVPPTVRRQLAVMLKTGESMLKIDREATSQEYELEEARTGRPAKRPLLVQETIAEIKGLESLREENDLRQILVMDLEEHVKKFEELNIDVLTSRELAQESKWCGTVETQLELAAAALKSAQTLLKRENLEPLLNVIQDEAEQRSFKKYLGNLP